MNELSKEKTSPGDLLRMTAEVAAAYVGNNSLPASQLPDVIKTIYSSISKPGARKGTPRAAKK
jgi:predicted transcriptional regulator